MIFVSQLNLLKTPDTTPDFSVLKKIVSRQKILYSANARGTTRSHGGIRVAWLIVIVKTITMTMFNAVRPKISTWLKGPPAKTHPDVPDILLLLDKFFVIHFKTKCRKKGMEEYVNTRLLRKLGGDENTIELSLHPDLTLDVIKAFPNKAWGFQGFHNHPNFTFEWVREFPNRYWDWNRLSEKVDLDTIAHNPNFSWNWNILTNRFSPKELLRYPGLPWDFSMFYATEITEEHIPMLETFQHLIPEWKWHYIAKATPWGVFKKALHLPWLWFAGDIKIRTNEFLPDDASIIRELEILCNWIKLSIYVHVDIINANPDLPWNREFLQWNRTTWKTPIEPVEKCVRQWVAANTIKRFWKRAISDPAFKMCRCRIFREFKELERFTSSMSSSTISFTKLREDAIIPSKATPGAIGLDLHSVESYVVFPGQRVVVSTGVKAHIPEGGGVYGRIAPRSGLAVKHGLDVGAGVVDPGDQSEIRVVLFNHDDHRPFVIRPGYRIAQLILERAVDPIDVVELEPDFSAEVV